MTSESKARPKGSRVTGREKAQSRHQIRPLVRTPAVWVLGVVVAAVGSSLTAVIVGVVGNYVDPAKPATNSLAVNRSASRKSVTRGA